MNTAELIERLSADCAPVPTRVGERRLSLGLSLSVTASVLVLLTIYGIRPDLGTVATSAAFAIKIGVPLMVAAGGVLALMRLGHPGRRTGVAAWLAATPVALLWLWAAWVWWDAPAAERLPLLLGNTWRTCVLHITALALPAALAGWWTLRGLAPTRPGLAGAAAGWMAGGIGAAVYALHCPELAAPFLAVWYVLGMAVPAVIGAWVGQRWLRW